MTQFFTVNHRSKRSKARLGTLTTPHGVVATPTFVPVGTKATIKGLTPSQVQEIGVQIAFVNTYHLVTHPGASILESAGGVHAYGGLSIPLMSDSAGFQVFSLANQKRVARVRADEEPIVLKISADGVKFRSVYDGSIVEFTPERSMEFQRQIGADLIMAFDECTYYPATIEYARKAMDRSHEWLKRCISQFQVSKSKFQNNLNKQNLYGIIQGGTYESLRKQSAEFVVNQDVPGIAIGGVSVGETKKEMRDVVSWVSPYLPESRPVHLLGVGQFDDILDLVTQGIDTFDCVEPTRLARMGMLYNFKFKNPNFKLLKHIEVGRAEYKNDMSRVDEECGCYTCTHFTKSYLHHLFKQKELLGYTLATYHNLWTMERFMQCIRECIAQDTL